MDLPEGKVTITGTTAHEVRQAKRLESLPHHFQAVARLPELLTNSRLAIVEKPEGKPNVAEVHKRYAWADFPDGSRKHVLMTVLRWKGDVDSDTAYSLEAIEVQEKAPDAIQGVESSTPDANTAIAGVADTITQFLAGIKPEHRSSGGSAFSLAEIETKWEAQGVRSSLSENEESVTLHKIVVPEEERGQGKGTAFMNDLVRYADQHQKAILLSPSIDFGGTSESRLKNFYKRFGFVENKGKKRNFKTRESMIRQGDSSFSLGPAAVADALRGDVISRIKAPDQRIEMMSRISRNVEGISLQLKRLELLAGGKRLRKSLMKEAAMREATRAEELEQQAWARHYTLFEDDDLVKIKSQPLHALLADPSSALRGRLMSKNPFKVFGNAE
ncbi:MAG: hypothetical protein QM680_13090 [Luteolibacter sp.]